MRHHWISVFIVVLVFVGGSGSAFTPPQDDLGLTTENTTASPGTTATVTVSVTNTGNQTVGGNYTLTVNASTVPAGWQTNVSNMTIVRGALAPNESRTTTLSISVSENASAGDYELQTELVSGERMWTTATVDVRVQPTEESPDRGTDDGGSSATTEHAATTTENVSGGSVALAVGGDGPSKWERLLAFLRSPKGIAALAILLVLGFAAAKSR